jgi:hypothetical protein
MIPAKQGSRGVTAIWSRHVEPTAESEPAALPLGLSANRSGAGDLAKARFELASVLGGAASGTYLAACKLTVDQSCED